MDDLKVVLYIVVAIIWVVYNNYKKIAEASKKRNFSKPPAEIIQENWPKTAPTVLKTVPPVLKTTTARKTQYVEKQSERTASRMLQKEAIKVRDPIKRVPLASRSKMEKTFLNSREGGTTQPSKVAYFEEAQTELYTWNPVVDQIKNTDMKTAIILSEILKRPYN
ncbi:MAG: hypothetical protein IPP71_23045 [Bacteroidetes bacterium]|nr:hypothetical protein [Bacteroidota bacterium]